MRKQILLLLGLFLLAIPWLHAQEDISGIVYEISPEGDKMPLEQVAVYWMESRKATYTDSLGSFSIQKHNRKDKTLIFHYITYEDDTLLIDGPVMAPLTITFSEPLESEVVEIRARELDRFISTLDPMNVEIIGQGELAKAACCNLSESFLTNSTVNVKESDGVSGAREIKMLGLAGRYTQILTEKRGMTRGLGYLYGLSYIPGDWLQSIQISKGAGSVVNGYESMTGEINLELKKPEDHNPLHLNLYGNVFGRMEANLISTMPVGQNAHTGIYAHAGVRQTEWDPDGDGFMNAPRNNTFILMNRWKYVGKNGLRLQAGIKALMEEREGGTIRNLETEEPTRTPYLVNINTSRIEGYSKIGWVHPFRCERTFGTVISGFYHDFTSAYGVRGYTGTQGNFRVSWTWQDYFGKPQHKYRVGWSYYYDNYRELLQWTNQEFTRVESVPGVFGEYTYNPEKKVTFVGGIRADYHNLWGVQVSPRLHLKVSPSEDIHLRFSAGRGFRTPNRVAENMSALASSRIISFEDDLSPEIAYTFGFSGLQNFKLGEKEFCLTADIYRTQFEQQLIVDLEDPRRLRFYNLDGASYSNTVQVELGGELVEGLDTRVAYKFQDVTSTYDGQLKLVPFTPAHRGLLTISYKTPNDLWNFDFTTAYTGVQRVPSTRDNPLRYEQPTQSPAFFTLYAQMSRKFDRLELYIGGENLTNYRQQVPVVAPDEPFGPYFDSSLIWGPTMGANAYAGLRFDLK